MAVLSTQVQEVGFKMDYLLYVDQEEVELELEISQFNAEGFLTQTMSGSLFGNDYDDFNLIRLRIKYIHLLMCATLLKE